MAKVYTHRVSIHGIEQFSAFVAMGTTSPRPQKFLQFYFTHCISQTSLSLRALMILDLIKIILRKCPHYTPEPR